MYPVSQEFIEKVRANTRKIYGRIAIDYTDPSIDQSVEVETNENANISYPNQVIDNVKDPAAKYASLDGSWILGEGYVLAPLPEEASVRQMGWWGSRLAGVGGVFSVPYPTLAVTFNPRPITKLQAVGDSQRQEWPVDFDINLYSGVNIVYTEIVIDNDVIEWKKTLDEPETEITKIELVVKKWSHADRQAKILEFFTSVQETYEGEDIISIDLIEEKETGAGLPVGHISSNEIAIKLNNVSRKFDVGNKQSPVYQLLKPNRRIRAWVGIMLDNEEMEWVSLGLFWSGDWKANDAEVSAETSGRDRLELLRRNKYSTSAVQLNKNLYDLAVDILQDAGLSQGEYWVDTELQDFIVPYAYFDEQEHREALRKIAEACLGQVYCDRDGVIRIEGPSYMENLLAGETDTYYLKGEFPAEIDGVINAFGIGPADYFRKDNPPKSDGVANHIEVETQPLTIDSEKEVYRSNEPVTITAGETKTMTVYYNETPCIEANAHLVGAPTGCVIQDAKYYAWGADITVYSPNAGTFILVIEAKPLKVVNKEKVIEKDDASIAENGLLTYKFPANPLVQTISAAQSIVNKLLNMFKDSRRDVEMDWRGNPALLLGDIVMVPDYKDERGYFYVTKNELEFSGALRARLSGRRIRNGV